MLIVGLLNRQKTTEGEEKSGQSLYVQYVIKNLQITPVETGQFALGLVFQRIKLRIKTMKIKARVDETNGQTAQIFCFDGHLKKDAYISIETKPKRSSAQNRLYFKMLELVSEDTGYTKEELHQLFKSEFLGDKIEVLDRPFMFTRSTTKLKKDEFGKYLTDIRYYVLDKLGYNLPIE